MILPTPIFFLVHCYFLALANVGFSLITGNSFFLLLKKPKHE